MNLLAVSLPYIPRRFNFLLSTSFESDQSVLFSQDISHSYTITYSYICVYRIIYRILGEGAGEWVVCSPVDRHLADGCVLTKHRCHVFLPSLMYASPRYGP
jgi:hypothetical protein